MNLLNLIPTLALCDKSYMVQVFLVIKVFIRLACILVPIIIIIVTSITLVKAIQTGKDDDLKDNLKLLVKRIIAGLFIFFIPGILGYVFTNLVKGDGDNMIVCIESATKEKVASLKQKEEAEAEAERKAQAAADAEILKKAYEEQHKNDEEKRKIFEEAREKFRNSQDSVSIANGEMFTPETQRIIQNHANDFDYSTFKSFMSSHGGMQGYANELGGVFKKYYGVNVPPVTCASDLQEVSEYVFGFMYLYGFDYYNGSKYCKWGGECGGSQAASDAFYPSGVKHDNDGLSSPKSKFDNLISGSHEVNMTTNCNWSVDMVYYKAGLFGGPGQPTSSSSFRSMGKKYKVITSAQDLQVGDILHFFRKSIDKSNPATWDDWYHVAYVGEVNKTEGYIIGYDGGSYFTNNKNFKWKGDIASGELHGTKNWSAVRIADIKQTC